MIEIFREVRTRFLSEQTGEIVLIVIEFLRHVGNGQLMTALYANPLQYFNERAVPLGFVDRTVVIQVILAELNHQSGEQIIAEQFGIIGLAAGVENLME